MKTLLVILCIMLSLTVQADDTQRRDYDRRTLTARPLPDLENLYFSLADLSLDDQRQQMWGLSSSTKAALWTYNTERYLLHHPELSVEGQELLREGVRLINTPGWFDIQEGSIGYAAKRIALAEFKRDFEKILPAEVIYEVLIRLGSEPASGDIRPHRPSTPTAPSVQTNAFYHCSCGSGFDCGSTSSYGCYDSWCIPTPSHCGPFADDPCWGRCKSTGE